MKTTNQILAVVILVLMPVLTFSQTLSASLYSASKLSSMGSSLGVQLPGFIGDIELGVFYETYSIPYFSSESNNSSERLIDTKGIYTSFSVVSRKKWDVNLAAKIGYAGEGIVINPSLGAGFYVSNYFGVGIETKLEIMKPVIQGKLMFNLFGGKNRLARLDKYAKRRSYFKQLRRNRY